MIKWFVYIVFLLVFTPCILLAKVKFGRNWHAVVLHKEFGILAPLFTGKPDTVKTKNQTKPDSKVKEVAKAKKQPKPAKVDDTGGDAKKPKAKRERRPDGMERPPEIPRRNDN